jgi:hypothetical protein
VLVRTEPPHRKRDVPLNASLLVVFSEPVDPGTVTTEVVRLFRGTVPVAGRVQLDPSGVKAVFQPEAALDPGTEYTLGVTSGVKDLSGDSLPAPVAVGFETQSDVSSAAGTYERQTPHSLPGYHSRYVLREDGGFELQYETVTWGNFAYTGHYWLTDSVIDFRFDAWNRAGPWDAVGTLMGDSLVVNFNTVMQLADFEDGVYERPPIPSPVGRLR